MAPFCYLRYNKQTIEGDQMATWVFKDGEGVLISPHDVDNHLKAGYTLDKKPKPAKKEKKEKRQKPDDEQKYT